MMLRKRAWDMMRDEFPSLREDASLAEAVRLMRDTVREHPDNHLVVITTKAGKLAGVISVWSVLKAVKESVLKDENLKVVGETDWDLAFKNACLICTQLRLDDFIDRSPTTVRPNDAALVVLDRLLKKREGWAVVVEADKIMGLVLVADLYREMTRDMLEIV